VRSTIDSSTSKGLELVGDKKSSNIPISGDKCDARMENSSQICQTAQATCHHGAPAANTAAAVSANAIRSCAFAKLVSNSSSLDEGVESDLSSPTVSSSFSNDLLSSSITSCYSMQVSSFESQSSQKSVNTSSGFHYMHTSIDQASLPSCGGGGGCGCGFEKKTALQAFSLMRKQRFANLKKLNTNRKHHHHHHRGQHSVAARYKQVNDLRQVRLELNSLMNDVAYGGGNSSNNNNNNDYSSKQLHMNKLNTIEHTPEKEQQSTNESRTADVNSEKRDVAPDVEHTPNLFKATIANDLIELNATSAASSPLNNADTGNLLQKCKQFIFFNSSRKIKNEENKASNNNNNNKQPPAAQLAANESIVSSSKAKKVLLKQKSSSLNSLIEDHNAISNKKCELNRPINKTGNCDAVSSASNNNSNNNNATFFKKGNSNSFKLKYFRKYSLNK
jgi:hypothetical protein